MKININEGLIFEDFEKRVKVEYSSELFGIAGLNKKNYLIASLLSWLKSFNKKIQIARQRLKSFKIVTYPQNETVENVLRKTIFSLNQEDQNKLKEEAREITANYKLTESWIIPIELVIITNTLIVPPSESIRIHYPDYFYDEPKKYDMSSQLGAVKRRLEVTNYPALFFTRKVKANELIKWLKVPKNRNLFNSLQFKLPDEPSIKRDENTLFWGQAVWLVKREGENSWVKITSRLEELLGNHNENDKNTDAPETVPAPEELKKYYDRFLESLKRVEIN